MNDGGGNGARCGGIEVRTDTTKLSDMVVASFGDGRNLVGKGKIILWPNGWMDGFHLVRR